MDKIRVDEESIKKLNLPVSYLIKSEKIDRYLKGGDFPIQTETINDVNFGFLRRKSKYEN